MKTSIRSNRIRTALVALFGDTRGAEMVEVLIITGVVSLAAIGAFTAFGGNIKSKIAEEGGKVSGIVTE